jgi:hypothetical protein
MTQLSGWTAACGLRELREYAEHRGLTIIGEYIDRMTGTYWGRQRFGLWNPRGRDGHL